MEEKVNKAILILCILLVALQCYGFDWNLNNQFTSTTTLYDDFTILESSLNYIPEVDVNIFQIHNNSVDSKFAYDLNFTYTSKKDNNIKVTDKLYRCWLRFSTLQSEFRIGLQKLNFGPARILRALQWFDNIDPTDPTQTTEGEKAILGRYYFLNNANIWLWGIWGEKNETSVINFFREKDNLEFGGRIQYPFQFCETALTYHHQGNENNLGEENRFGFDARWDFAMGFWTEFVVSQFTKSPMKYSREITLGTDYTFSYKNGIYILAEYNKYSAMATKFFQETESTDMIAMSLSYPINLFDNLSSILTYDIDGNDIYSNLTYQRTYDYFSLYLTVFFNPKKSSMNASRQNGNTLQLLIKYDF